MPSRSDYSAPRSFRFRRPAPIVGGMPIVTILQGPRDADVKRELLKKSSDSFVDVYAIPAKAVQVWFQDTPPDSWGTGHKLQTD
jgi:4-oxalocrotonate tautomerase